MNPVAPVNILLSTDLNNLERVIESGGNIIQANPGTYLFSSKNTNFISLEHELRDKQGFAVNITIQDPDNNVLDNLLPKNANEFLENDGEKSQITFFLLYGLGKSVRRHWAGPFICQLQDFNYYQTATGTFMIEMSFVPSLPIQAILSLENLGSKSSVLKSPNGRAKPSSSGDKQSRNTIGSTGTAVKLGNVSYSPRSGGFVSVKGFLDIGISLDDFIEKVRILYTNYARHWGVDNFLMVFGEEFKKACKDKFYKKLTGFGGSTQDVVNFFGLVVPVSLHTARLFLAEFGIALKVVSKDNKRGFGSQDYGELVLEEERLRPGARESVEIYIDISNKYKDESKFREVFDKFYSTLRSTTGLPISPEYLIESNTQIIRYLKESAGAGNFIKDLKKPLVIIGERNCIAREIHALGGRGEILVPLSDEKTDPAYKELLQNYYVNKTSHVYRSNYFEGAGSLEDDMSFSEALEYDELTDMLTFKANTVDSNILDYNFDLNLATFKEFVKSFSQPVGSDQLEYIKNYLSKMIPFSNYFETDEFSESLVKILNSPTFENVGQQVTVTGSGYKSAYANFVKDLNDKGVQGNYMAGTIRTIPYFQLSDNLMLNSPCQITINKTPNLDNYPIDPEDTESFFSGRYIIIGFRHIISSNDVYSEFDVLRIPIREKSSS